MDRRVKHYSRDLQRPRARRQGHVETPIVCQAGRQSPRDKRSPWDQLNGASIRPSQPSLRPLTPQEIPSDKAQSFQVQAWDVAPSLRPFTPELQAWDTAPSVRPCTPPDASIEKTQVQHWSIPAVGTSQASCRRRANPAASLPPLQGGVRHRSSRHARHRSRANEKVQVPAHSSGAVESNMRGSMPPKMALVEFARAAPSSDVSQSVKAAGTKVSDAPPQDATAKRSPTGMGDSRQMLSSDAPTASIWTTAADGTQVVAWDKLVATITMAVPKDGASAKYDAFLSPCRKPRVAFADKLSSRTKGSSLPALSRSCRSPDLTIEVADLCAEQAADDKHVTFCDKGDEIFDAFTPYGCVYGEHPSEFDFNDSGHMVATSPDVLAVDNEAIDAGDLVECTASCGVGYRTIPQFAARFDDLRTLHIGERVKIEERSGEWLRDSVGWFPLFINSTVVVEIVRPSAPISRLRKARRGVMVVEVDKSASCILDHD